MKICSCRVLYSSLAQSVERMTVNHDVAGSSPAGGAKKQSTSWGTCDRAGAPRRFYEVDATSEL